MPDSIDLSNLTPDPLNANRHTERGLGLLEDSIRDLGFGDSLTVDRNDRIISGNARADTLVALGMTDAIVVETDGSRPIVHRRVDLDLEADPDHRARLLALSENHVAHVNYSPSPEILLQIAEEQVPIAPIFGHDLTAILSADPPTIGPPIDPPAAPRTTNNMGALGAGDRVGLQCGDIMVTLDRALYERLAAYVLDPAVDDRAAALAEILRGGLDTCSPLG